MVFLNGKKLITKLPEKNLRTAGRNSSDSSSEQGLFLIPLQLSNSNEIQSYISCYKHNDSLYTYRLYNKDSLEHLQNQPDSLKSKLMNALAVFSFFEKTVNGKDSVLITSPYHGYIKNANIEFADSQTAGRSAYDDCYYHLVIEETYTFIGVFVNGYLVYSYESYTCSIMLEISCDGFGNGGTGNGNGGSFWWQFGTGWPYSYGSYNVSYDDWNYWWTNGGGGGSGGGSAPAYILTGINTDSLLNPCLLGIVNSITSSNGHNIFIDQLYQQYFGTTSDVFKIRYIEDTTLTGPGHSDNPDTLPNGEVQWTIRLNPNILQNASKEFIATVIFHELVHSFIVFRYTSYPTTPSQHEFIFMNFVEDIKDAVKRLYPGSPDSDYISLALEGLDDAIIDPATGQPYPAADSYSIFHYGTDLTTARNRGLQFFNGTAGTHC
jgi:hypothetical protein